MSTIPSNLATAGSGNHSALGIAGGAGLLLEFKHGIPAILTPFENCHGIMDFFATIDSMDDKAFLGIFLWLILLMVSFAAVLVGFFKLAKLLIVKIREFKMSLP